MSGPFSSIDIARSGLGFNKFWMDTIAHNISNINTMTTPGQEPFRALMVVAMPISQNSATGGGVSVSQVLAQEGEPALTVDPDNPLADADGNVAAPLVDLGSQMGDLIMASRSYQANMSVFKEARQSLEAATSLGRG
jgi:flagellar basal-body rod protein FlgC